MSLWPPRGRTRRNRIVRSGAIPKGRSGRQTKSGVIRADVPDWVLVTGAGKAHAELQSSAGVVELDV
jgi:hypothetical protein